MSQSPSTDDETSMEEATCDESTLTSCQSLQNIANALKYYQTLDIGIHNKHDLNKLALYFEEYTDLVSDYHHLLSHHLNCDKQTLPQNNESFYSIYNIIISIVQCRNIHKCAIYIRSHRDRHKHNHQIAKSLFSDLQIIADESLWFHLDFMDTIHCHLLHSYHSGYRLLPNTIQADDDTPQEHNGEDLSWLVLDSEMIQLKQHLKWNRDYVQKLRGDIRFYNHKFVTSALGWNEPDTNEETKDDSSDTMSYPQARYLLSDSSDNYVDITDTDTDDESESHEEDTSIPRTEAGPNYCSFGQRYYYWSYYKHNWYDTNDFRWSVDHKYSNLRDEMMNNTLCRLDIETYHYVYYKASKILQESDELKSQKSALTEIKLHYGVCDNIAFAVSNVMSIILYTDYDFLSYNLSKTFHKLTYYEENEEQMKQRNSEYWHWSKLLRETLECYGSMMTDSSVETYYHCMNKMPFPCLNARICGPISTTARLEVIASFVYDNGLVLELQPDEIGSSLRMMNCSFFSCFPQEEERLLFGGADTLKFTSIRVIKANANYEYFIRGIQLLDHVMNAQPLDAIEEEEEPYNIIEALINEETEHRLPTYMISLWTQYRAQKKYIELNLGLFNTDHQQFKPLFVDTRTNNLIWIDFVCNIFKNCERVVIENNNRHLSSRYLSMLLRITETVNRDEEIQLRCITVENVQMEEEQFDEFVEQFDDNDWNMKLKQTKTVQFGVWIDIANLTLHKIQRALRSSSSGSSEEMTPTTATDTGTTQTVTVMESVTAEAIETEIVLEMQIVD
eukprot:533916_1